MPISWGRLATCNEREIYKTVPLQSGFYASCLAARGVPRFCFHSVSIVSYRIVSLDPSMTACGWAVMEPGQVLIEAGIMTSSPRKGDSRIRIESLCDQWRSLLEQWKPQEIVIEWTTGHVVRSRHGGGGAGLSIYGIAVGALWRESIWWAKLRNSGQLLPAVHTVTENQWTGGRPKIRKGGQMFVSRQDIVAGLYPIYRPQDDPGGDVADAVLLNYWWQRQRRLDAARSLTIDRKDPL